MAASDDTHTTWPPIAVMVAVARPLPPVITHLLSGASASRKSNAVTKELVGAGGVLRSAQKCKSESSSSVGLSLASGAAAMSILPDTSVRELLTEVNHS